MPRAILLTRHASAVVKTGSKLFTQSISSSYRVQSMLPAQQQQQQMLHGTSHAAAQISSHRLRSNLQRTSCNIMTTLTSLQQQHRLHAAATSGTANLPSTTTTACSSCCSSSGGALTSSSSRSIARLLQHQHQHQHQQHTGCASMQRHTTPNLLQHVRCAASFGSGSSSGRISISRSSKSSKTQYVCEECGQVTLQYFGKCRGCGQYNTIREQLVSQPNASGSDKIKTLLRGGSASSSSNSNTGGNSSSSRRPTVSRQAQGSSSSTSYAPAAASNGDSYGDDDDGDDDDPYSDPSFLAEAENDDSPLLFDELTAAGGRGGSSSGSSSRRQQQQPWQQQQRGSWIVSNGSSGGQQQVPRRLSDMLFEAKDLRLPLFGATGEEMARVLGGGVVPGSVVLVGGEPGKGKSTLLLQLAALVAQSCQHQHQQPQQQQQAAAATSASNGGSNSKEEEEDMPLSARQAAVRSSNGGQQQQQQQQQLVRSLRDRLSSSSSGGGGDEEYEGWLQDAAAAIAAAAAGAGGGGGVPVPRHCVGRPVLYVTAEESDQQVWERAKRLGIIDATVGGGDTSSSNDGSSSRVSSNGSSNGRRPLDVRLVMQSDLVSIAEAIIDLQPAAVVVDSIQTVSLEDTTGRPGGVAQVRACATALVHVAKSTGCATFLVGHVTKDGSLAGPKNLEHLVDVVLSLEGAGRGQLRMLRATKNRHGRQGEVGIFEMRNTGLEAVANAAALFAPSAAAGSQQLLSDGTNRLVGTAIAVIQDGARPLPIEIQALAAPRIRVVSPEPARAVDDGWSDDDDEDGYDFTDAASDSYMAGGSPSGSSSRDEDSSDDPFVLGMADGDDDGEDEDSSSSSSGSSGGGGITGAGLMRGSVDRLVAAEAGVSPKEILPLVRSVLGLNDKTRMGMLLELLTIHTPIKSHQFNLYVNVVAGVTLPRGETMADLPLLAAVVSSVLSTPLPPATALMGECGLGGELRVGQQQLQMRVLELAKLGFDQVIIPSSAPNLGLSPADLGDLKVVRRPTLRSALEHCFGAASLRRAGRAAVVTKPAKQQQQQWRQQQQGGGAGGSGGGGAGGGGSSGAPIGRRRSSSRRTASG